MGRLHLNDLLSDDPELKYCAAKRAIAISKEKPEDVYSSLDFFAKLLDSDNQTINCAAIQVIGNLSHIDKRKKIDGLLSRLVRFLNAGKYMTANHAILGLTQIALSKPEFRKRIIRELLKVENYEYETEEYKNFILGKVILGLGEFKNEIENDPKALDFLERQSGNARHATKKKADDLLHRLDKLRKIPSEA